MPEEHSRVFLVYNCEAEQAKQQIHVYERVIVPSPTRSSASSASELSERSQNLEMLEAPYSKPGINPAERPSSLMPGLHRMPEINAQHVNFRSMHSKISYHCLWNRLWSRLVRPYTRCEIGSLPTRTASSLTALHMLEWNDRANTACHYWLSSLTQKFYGSEYPVLQISGPTGSYGVWNEQNHWQSRKKCLSPPNYIDESAVS